MPTIILSGSSVPELLCSVCKKEYGIFPLIKNQCIKHCAKYMENNAPDSLEQMENPSKKKLDENAPTITLSGSTIPQFLCSICNKENGLFPLIKTQCSKHCAKYMENNAPDSLEQMEDPKIRSNEIQLPGITIHGEALADFLCPLCKKENPLNFPVTICEQFCSDYTANHDSLEQINNHNEIDEIEIHTEVNTYIGITEE